jgi:hypothetical protein
MYEVALSLSAICFLLTLIFYVKSSAFNVYHPAAVYLAFHGVVFVLRPILAYFFDFHQMYAAYDFNPSADDKLTVILASNLGFLTFMFFCLRKGYSSRRSGR